MQVLLRNVLSGNFLDDTGGWTRHQQNAKNFEKTFHAIEAAAKLDPSQLEVLLSFEDPVLKPPIPLSAVSSSRPTASARMSGADPDANQIPWTGVHATV
jgi:hypothetical protein